MSEKRLQVSDMKRDSTDLKATLLARVRADAPRRACRGTATRAFLVTRGTDAILGQPLRLVIEQPSGRGRITVSRGIVIH